MTIDIDWFSTLVGNVGAGMSATILLQGPANTI